MRRGRRRLLPLAYVYGVIHVVNAIGHVTVSLAGRWFAPGVYSAPLLLASARWLLYETDGVRRRPTPVFLGILSLYGDSPWNP